MGLFKFIGGVNFAKTQEQIVMDFASYWFSLKLIGDVSGLVRTKQLCAEAAQFWTHVGKAHCGGDPKVHLQKASKAIRRLDSKLQAELREYVESHTDRLEFLIGMRCAALRASAAQQLVSRSDLPRDLARAANRLPSVAHGLLPDDWQLPEFFFSVSYFEIRAVFERCVSGPV
jgi:hypothetical protein